MPSVAGLWGPEKAEDARDWVAAHEERHVLGRRLWLPDAEGRGSCCDVGLGPVGLLVGRGCATAHLEGAAGFR
ncbi:hypothetical protein NDU88_005322 [Pleurodeles waltl]|uniref:Uncharacterized protein n=1 Tax=Pleurodeles waltl TaxID=8319 RepID=A0AAV7RIQ8_PLEWA|nr:hypothetical protein NDU88_005322 [Pleurodeles waltl]